MEVEKGASWRRTRLTIGFLVLAAYAVAAIWWYRECSILSAGGEPTKSTCAPPTVTSATVLVLLLLVVLLLWPDISEITVLGISLKRKVEQAKQAAMDAKSDATEAQNDVRDLTATVQTLQVQLNTVVLSSANSSAAATISQSILVPDVPWSAGASAEVQKSVLDLQREVSRNDQSDPRSPARSRAEMNLESVRAGFRERSLDELKMQLIRDWETLDSLLGVRPSSSPRGSKIMDEEERQLRNVQQAFIADHRDTLAGIRSLRNAVAHAQDVSRKDVEDGLEALALIRPLAEQWMRAYSVPSRR